LPNRTRHILTSDLHQITARHQLAQDLTQAAAADHPADIWQHLLAAFADIPALTAQISHLRADLAGARLQHANLAAAALAAIAAHDEGETDPLCYLRDELRAQGHDVSSRGRQ
jgi:hypothetical protein